MSARRVPQSLGLVRRNLFPRPDEEQDRDLAARDPGLNVQLLEAQSLQTEEELPYSVDGLNITFTYIPIGGPPYSWSGTVGTGNVTYTDPSTFVDIPGGVTAVYTK